MSRLALHTAIVLSIGCGVLLLWQLRYPVMLFALSLAMAAVLRPLIERLMARGWPKSLAVVVMYGQLVAAIVLLLAIALQPLLAETQRFGDTMMLAYERVAHGWPDRGGWREVIANQLPPPAELYESLVGQHGAQWLQVALGMTFSLFSNLVDLVVVMVMSIYWSLDRDHFERLWLSILPARRRIETRDVWRSLEFEAGDYLRSEIVQSTVAGILLWCGLTLFAYPWPVLVAIIGAVAWLVPWAGMLIAAAAVAVLALPRLVLVGWSPNSAWFFGSIAYTVLVLLALEVFVEPRVFGRRRYSSLLIAMVMVGLADVLGIVGLMLGPPLAAALQIIGTRLLRKRVMGEATKVESDLNEKVATLANELAEAERPAPELASMVDRLQDLVNEAQP
ncbi:MAG TPA: AI-2E family transporter [Pirellulales bacterium]|nr:AI-2E family transporter [Pirellulales bacterium]